MTPGVHRHVPCSPGLCAGESAGRRTRAGKLPAPQVYAGVSCFKQVGGQW
jgi:hypothetical protein